MNSIRGLSTCALVLTLFLAVSNANTHGSIGPLGLCKSLKRLFPALASGEYTVRGNAGFDVRVFCEYSGPGGYTYLSHSHLMSFPSTKTNHVNVKHLRSNTMQYDVKMKQISAYSRISMTVQFNSSNDFTRPVNNDQLNPYIYLGFIPAKLAQSKTYQGYNANNKDFTFRNCDKNPNSYLVFHYNNKNNAPVGYYKKCCYSKLMRDWINQSKPAKTFLPRDYFFQTEMHMGGCGGYAVSGYERQTDISGAALGIPFDLKMGGKP